MELEKRLERWDALFEELKEVVEHFIPAIEKNVNEALSKVNLVEQRVQKLEAEIESIKKEMPAGDQGVDQEKFREELDKIGKELGSQVASLRKELHDVRTTVSEELNKVSSELDSKIESLRESIPDSTVVSVPEGEIKRLEREIEDLKEMVGKLYREVEQMRTNMVERHRMLRERKVEGRSPRLL